MDNEGVLALVIPDKRFCFDHVRQITPIAMIIDANEAKRKIHSVGSAADYFLNVVSKGGMIAWGADHQGALKNVHTLKEAQSAMKAIRESGAFLDVHAWCFTPASFRMIMNDLYLLGYTRLREKSFFDTTGHEFFVSFSRNGTGPNLSRLELATQDAS